MTTFSSSEELLITINNFIKNKNYNEALRLLTSYKNQLNRNIQYYLLLGLIYKQLGKINRAIQLYKDAIQFDSKHPSAYINIAQLYFLQKNYVDAIKFLKEALFLEPENIKIIYLLARGLKKNNQFEEAIVYYKQVPHTFKYENVVFDLTHCYKKTAQYDFAIQTLKDYTKAFKKNMNAFIALGNLYVKQEKYVQALKNYGLAQEIEPNHFLPYLCVARIVKDKKKAINFFDKAYNLSKNKLSIYVEKILEQAKICDWSFWDSPLTDLHQLYINGAYLSPFGVFFLNDDPNIHQKIAKKNWQKVKKAIQPLTTQFENKNTKIRIGYISQNFGVHAMMYLAPSLFRYFDREKFEVFSYSLIYKNNKSTQQDLVKEFSTKFFNVENFDSKKIAKLIFSHKIDILVDLSGYQKNCRPEVFAYKPAPIIINYLRNPGTMGSDVHDYFICDKNSLPEKNSKFYCEKKIYLPHTYFPYDDHVFVSNNNISKTNFGIPTDKVVLGCFNNIYKITPAEFNIWMKILSDIKNTVMVFKTGDIYAIENLKKEALRRNVTVDRLFFLKKMPHSEHLLTYKLIDIFLDTFNYNGHTTAIEALYMNVPVITKTGNHVASRAATGILRAIGLEELICASEKKYEQTIVKLLHDTNKLMILKKKLTTNKRTYNLFNSKLYVKNLERAYKIIHGKYQTKSPITDIYIE